MRRLIGFVSALVLAAATIAVAYFTGAAAQARASASVGTLTAAATPAASAASSTTVDVTWTASEINSSTAATSYTVERYSGAGADLGAASCGTVPSSSGNPNAFGSFSCTDTPGTTGTFEYKITAHYNSSWSASTAYTGTVTLTSTSIAAPATDPTSTAIAASSISSTLAGGTTSPAVSGTITFKVFGPQSTAPTTCTSGGTTVGTATVSGNGTYHPSAGYTPGTAGTYWWYASYGGDTHNTGSTGSCGSGMASTVVTNTTTTTATASSTGTAATAIAASSITSGLSGGTTSPAVSGTITFYVFGPQTTAPATCTSGGTTVGTATVSGNGTTYHPNVGFTPEQAGSYWWYASYGGDTYNGASNSTCGSSMAKTTVAKASPTETVSSPSSDPAATPIAAGSISSTLTGGSTTATGTITFKVFGPQSTAPTTCTTGGTTVGTATVSGANSISYNPSAGFTPTTQGTYWWYASYGGDTSNNSKTTTCGTGMTSMTAGKASPTITVTAPATDATNGAIATSSISSILADAYSTATGTITFKVFGPQTTAPTTCTSGGTTVGTATISSNGTYHPSAGETPTTAGTYWWYASYGGDTNDNTSASTCGTGMTSTVVTNTTTTTASGPTTGTAGTAIPTTSINSVLSGGTTSPAASGTVTFYVFGPQSTAPTTCTSAGTTVGTATVSGNATYHPSASFTPEVVGTYWWYASYSGDTYNSASNSTCGTSMGSTTVGKSSPTLTPGAPATDATNSAISASSLSVTLATSTTPATGTLTFKVFGPQSTAPTSCTSGGTTVGTATVTGAGSFNPSAGYTPTTVGTYWWYVSYNGDSNNNSAVSTCGTGMTSTAVKNVTSLTVTAPASEPTNTNVPTSSISSTLSGGTTSPAVSGTLTIYVIGPQSTAPTSCTGGTVVGTDTVTANGTYNPAASWNPSSTGTYWWYASYGGDTYNFSSSTTCATGMTSTVVANTTTTTVSAPSSAVAGSTIAGGQNSSIGASLQSGSGATGTVTITVFGPQATAPTTCTSGGTTVSTPTVSGPGTYHPSSGYSPPSPGTYWWYASYSGDSGDAASSSTCGSGMASTTVSIAAPTATLSVSPSSSSSSPEPAGTTFNPSATLSSAATGASGTLTFTVFGPQANAPTSCTSGGTTVGTASVSGSGTYPAGGSFTPSTAGTYWWYVSYNGDTNDSAAASACGSGMSSSVLAPTLTLTGPGADTPNGQIQGSSLSATLSGATANATGSITVMMVGPQSTAPSCSSGGGGTVGSASVSGNGTYHPGGQATPGGSGDYWFCARYGGDGNNAATYSSPVEVTIWSAGSATSTTTTTANSTSSTTSSFSVQAGTPYLLLISRSSATGDSVSGISSTISPSPTFTSVGSSTTFNGGTSYQWAYYFTPTSASSGTITVNFAKALASGKDTVIDVVQLTGASASTPVVTGNVATASGTGTTATADLTNAPASGDVTLVFLSGAGSLGSSTPTGTGLTNVFYSNNSDGSAGSWDAIPAQQSSSLSIASGAWGTMAIELMHG